MKKSLILLACLSALAACSRGAPDGKAGYRDPAGLFSLRGPAQWRVLESQGGAQRVSFLGPVSRPNAFSASISVYYYKKGGTGFQSPDGYIASEQASAERVTPVEKRTWKERPILAFTSERMSSPAHGSLKRERLVEDTLLIPTAKGFFALVHSAPLKTRARTAEVFEDVLESFLVSD